MAHRTLAATLASRANQPLSPPHSDHEEVSKEVDREIDDNKPMDLSSGGAVSGVTNLFGRGFCETMPISDHPLLNARRLAELVRQQHFESEERERDGKRKWEEQEGEDEDNHDDRNEVTENPQNLIPLHLIRSKWSGSAPSPEHPDCSPDRMEQGAVVSPGLPGSPAGSSSGSESGREEKRRRLDLLLNKKFEKVTSVEASAPLLHSTPPPSECSLPSDSHVDRRPSLDGVTRVNRRKQAHPSNPGSPPSLTIRPNSDLFPPIATSTPRDKRDDSPSTRVPDPSSRPSSPTTPQDYSPARKMSRPQSPVVEENDNKDAIKNQILQVHIKILPSNYLQSCNTLQTTL